MSIINILDKQTANLIAAGEVVERPSSAIKEMLENCADAGADKITVEIKNGGTSFIRITDNGCGMSREDVPKCIMRHATSKIKNGSDLEAIGTFGFRGEALAAISSVSRVRIITKTKDSDMGTVFQCDFGEQVLLEDSGCPDGTTITVENIFENVPARRKFLKKDSTEALSVFAVCEKFALSRSEIALTFISDNNVKIQTPGDGNILSAVYSCMGREFASSLVPVDYELSSVHIYGYIAKPEFSRPNRNLQSYFVNRRYIRSRTMLAAVEEGFRGFCPTGKFPACLIFCDVDLRLVDVNVHPAKLEIKFSDERQIFDAIYYAVKNTLSRIVRFDGFTSDDSPEFPNLSADNGTNDGATEQSKPSAVEIKNNNSLPKAFENEISKEKPIEIKLTEQGEKQNEAAVSSNPPEKALKTEKYIPPVASNHSFSDFEKSGDKQKPLDFLNDSYSGSNINANTEADGKKPVENASQSTIFPQDNAKASDNITDNTSSTGDKGIKITDIASPITSSPPRVVEVHKQDEIEISAKLVKPKYIGEAFDTYIIVQYKGSLYLIDKHAAHERIIYEKLKKPDHENNAQYLLEPISITLTPKEALAASENKSYFENIGFDFDVLAMNTVLIRSIPTPISQSDTKDVFTLLAGRLSEGNNRSAGEVFDRALFTAACRAAIKAGDKNTDYDNQYIAQEIFSNEAVLYCPHGRPVIHEFTKAKLDKMFDRN